MVLGVVVDVDAVVIFDGDGDAFVGRDLPWVEDGSFRCPTSNVAVAINDQDHVNVDDHAQDYDHARGSRSHSSYALND